MKSLEEIQQLAKDSWEGCDGCDENDKYFFVKGFGCAYRQLKEDMVKLLEIEIYKAFMYGQRNGEMMEVGLERDEIEEYFNYRMLLLNKQH